MAFSADSHTDASLRPSLTGGDSLRPQLQRRHLADLSGTWDFAFDDTDKGLINGWHRGFTPQHAITVPFPPESEASGIGDTSFHRVLWYQRTLTQADLDAAGLGIQGDRVMLHFGAVDYRCEVWVNGQSVGRHEGGHVPFSARIDSVLVDASTVQTIVVRVEDDPHDVAQPRGKQDWQKHPHAIWYHRTSGIWQPVWLEAMPDLAIERLAWSSDLSHGTVGLHVELSARPAEAASIEVELSFEGEVLAHQLVDVSVQRTDIQLTLPRQTNGQDYEHLLWSPDAPRLLDAHVTLRPGRSSANTDGNAGGTASPAGEADVVGSYLGLRSVGFSAGSLLLNNRPQYLRAVLSQGYWPQSHLAAPSADALREEVELTLALGFNTARVHQKIEDPRFLYWADRLGLMLWEEMPSALESSTVASQRVVAEWMAAIERDSSHPSIIVWVPINESWGVQHISRVPQVAAYARGLADLTRGLDGSRPVISNDGWEHVNSDIISIHDYEGDGRVLAASYASTDAVDRIVTGLGPSGRGSVLGDQPIDRPVMLTEFGGVKFEMGGSGQDAWGYTSATGPEDFAARLRALIGAANASPVLAGWCYTQLTDTLQEQNGLLTEGRAPKLPMEELRAIVRGE